MQSARGAVLLFADADGATKFSDLTKLEDSLKEIVKGIFIILSRPPLFFDSSLIGRSLTPLLSPNVFVLYLFPCFLYSLHLLHLPVKIKPTTA